MRHACSWIILSVLFLQTCHGTSIAIVVSKTGDYVVLAADSRGLEARTKVPNNKMCKVIALDDIVLFNAGDVQA